MIIFLIFISALIISLKYFDHMHSSPHFSKIHPPTFPTNCTTMFPIKNSQALLALSYSFEQVTIR